MLTAIFEFDDGTQRVIEGEIIDSTPCLDENYCHLFKVIKATGEEVKVNISTKTGNAVYIMNGKGVTVSAWRWRENR